MKISYTHTWNTEGTYYRNRISMSREDFDKLNDIITTENIINKDLYPCYSPLRKLSLNNNVCYTDLTQANFIKKWVKGKRELNTYGRNTYIIVK